jgi:orotidine-5'-phosphate decarboxylase
MAHDNVDIVVVGEERDPVAVSACVVCRMLVQDLRQTTNNSHFVTPSMLNLRPSTLEYEARAATSFFAAGRAVTAATNERIVASFMLLWIETWR